MNTFKIGLETEPKGEIYASDIKAEREKGS